MPKVILAQIAILLLLLFGLLKNGTTKRLSFPLLALPILIIFSLSLAHLLLLSTPTTFFGNPVRMQGIFLLWHLLVLGLISSKIKFQPKAWLPFSAVLLLLLLALLNFNENGRAVGSLGEPNALAAVAIFLWPFLYFVQKSKTTFIKLISGLIAMILIILLSESESSLVALGFQSLFILLISFFRLSIFKSIFAVLVFIVLSLYLPFAVKPEEWNENRVEIWHAAARAGQLSPIYGHGFGNIEEALPKGSHEIEKNNVRFQYVDSSHNIFLDWWVQAGAVGILLLLFLIGKTIWDFAKQNKVLQLTCLMGLLAVMSFNPVSVVTLVAFWFLIGQGSSIKQA